MRRILNLYQKTLHRYPIVTQCVQTGIMMGAGDVISQTAIEKRHVKDIHWGRTLQFSCVGFFFVGPVITVWYRTLHKYVGDKGTSTAVKKVACDQLFFAPNMLAAILTLLGYLKTKNLDATMAEVKREYKDVLVMNYKLWPMTQLVNFYFVPLNYQVLFVQTVALFWNTYLSWKTQRSES